LSHPFPHLNLFTLVGSVPQLVEQAKHTEKHNPGHQHSLYGQDHGIRFCNQEFPVEPDAAEVHQQDQGHAESEQ
jgi:hypothetical protein